MRRPAAPLVLLLPYLILIGLLLFGTVVVAENKDNGDEEEVNGKTPPSVVKLTAETFNELLEDQNGLVRFMTPKCPYSKKMEDAWGRLGDEYEDLDGVLIGDVDCSSEREWPICEKFLVTETPALIHFPNGSDGDGVPYDGTRDVTSLREFAAKHMEERCRDRQLTEGCSAREKKFIRKMKSTNPKIRAEQLQKLFTMPKDQMESMTKSQKRWYNQKRFILEALTGKDHTDSMIESFKRPQKPMDPKLAEAMKSFKLTAEVEKKDPQIVTPEL